MKHSTETCRRATAATMPWRRLLGAALAALLGFAGNAPAGAQTASGGDPPTRVARLSDVNGQVWIYSADSDEWQTVERNRPLTSGDRIATDKGARAEIALGTTTLRLDAGTELEISRIDDTRFVVRLGIGSVAARLRNPQSLAEFEMNTDEGRFRVQTVGRYRFDRYEQTSDLTVFNGQAVYEGKNSALPVYTGQSAQFWIDASGVPQYAMVAPLRDAFAAWNDERDRGDERVAASRFVSPEMTGAEDLGRYGQWQQTPDYGPIWVPTSVPSGWAPYSSGHWAWVRPWGWTWVDDAPWGFAPFHYGRWVYHRDAWCWAPGTYVARPIYAPALVAWIGGPRAGVSVSVGGPPVGWFPLAPREVYVPSYRASSRYVRDVNYTHVSNVTTITTIVNNRNGEADRREFANRRFPQAVTFVPSDVMTRRQPVGPAAARFRNDPQIRALVADAQPATVLTAPPVTAPAAPPRLPPGRTAARPPFEGRTPGAFLGRPEAPRPDSARPELARPDTGRPDPNRSVVGRPDPGRVDAGRPDAGRPGERVGAPPTAVGPATAPRAIGPATSPTVVGPTTSPAPVGPSTAPTAIGAVPIGQPRVGAPAPNTGPAIGAPDRRGRDGNPPLAATDPATPQRVAPPTAPQQRGMPMGADGRPQFYPRGSRPPGETANGEVRAAPQAAPQAPLPTPNAATPDGSTGRRPDRAGLPRQPDAPRVGETARPTPAQVIRPAEGVAPAPAVVQRPAEPRAAEVQRPVGAEPRMTRPEAPRGRDDRRDEKGENRPR